jgi:restriction system protein
VTGRSGDEGIDGIIKEDALGLDSVYVQAKRYKDGTVGRPAIQAFVGALSGQHASKGVFITTSAFSSEARQFVRTITQKVSLIDGEELARLMIRTGVGVATTETLELKRIDSDYFEEE